MPRVSETYLHGIYTQLAIGDCGHVLTAWPQIHTKGERWAICDDCSRERLGLDSTEEFLWVRIAKLKQDPSDRKDAVVRAAKRATRKRTTAKKSASNPMQMLLFEAGVLGGP